VDVFREEGWTPWGRLRLVSEFHENMLASMMCLAFVEN
jgi:hypothetical protein